MLRLMAGGYSNREIAEALGTAEGTVKNHASSILSKLGVRIEREQSLRRWAGTAVAAKSRQVRSQKPRAGSRKPGDGSRGHL